jgi:hypothetical protein
MGSDQIKQQREEAWIGDAVLLLYARQRVLREQGTVNSRAEQLFTANGQLSSFSQPTETEACIGRCFTAHGLDAAMQWIRDNLEPIYAKQELARIKAAGGSRVLSAQKRSRRKK